MESNKRLDDVTKERRYALYDRLVAAGVSQRVAGDIVADLGDIDEGNTRVMALLEQVAEGADVEDALHSIDAEVQYHLVGHLKSMRRTVKALRKFHKKANQSKRGQPPTAE
jgi:hypothetical protein